MNTPRFRLFLGSLIYLVSLCCVGIRPLGAPILAFGGLMFVSGLGYYDLIRLGAAAVVVSAPAPQVQLALFGLLLLDGNLRRLRSDEASVGWILLFSSWIFTNSPEISRDVGAISGIIGVFLLAGIWPISWSWLRTTEPWGRRISRTLLGLYLLHGMIRNLYPLACDSWAPLMLFLPILGILWASGLLVSGRGDAAPYRLLISFETQVFAVFILSVRFIEQYMFVLAFWAVVLSLACIWSATRVEGGRPHPTLTRITGLGGVATLLAVPGLAGFPYRWSALSALLGASPAGFAGFMLGILLLPLTLRPIRDLLRSATPRSSLIAALLALGGSVLVGIVPGVFETSSDAFWLGEFLLRSIR